MNHRCGWRRLSCGGEVKNAIATDTPKNAVCWGRKYNSRGGGGVGAGAFASATTSAITDNAKNLGPYHPDRARRSSTVRRGDGRLEPDGDSRRPQDRHRECRDRRSAPALSEGVVGSNAIAIGIGTIAPSGHDEREALVVELGLGPYAKRCGAEPLHTTWVATEAVANSGEGTSKPAGEPKLRHLPSRQVQKDTAVDQQLVVRDQLVGLCALVSTGC